mgnify:CR=1 FL=1
MAEEGTEPRDWLKSSLALLAMIGFLGRSGNLSCIFCENVVVESCVCIGLTADGFPDPIVAFFFQFRG